MIMMTETTTAVKIAFGRESPRLVDLRIKKVLGLVGLKGVEKTPKFS